jgi:HEAT repeat protein
MLILAGLGGCWWLYLRLDETDPVYGGKRLSEWLNATNSRTWMLTDEAAEAVRRIGANAGAYLLKELGTPETAIDDIIEQDVTSPRARKILAELRYESRSDRRIKAERGISALGEKGVLMLAQGLTNSDKWVRLGCAGECMGHQDYPEILLRPLLRRLKDSDTMVREQAAASLYNFTNEPALVIPGLIQLLGDPEEPSRAIAIFTLGAFGPQAKSAVPAILKGLQSTNLAARQNATNALMQIDPATAAKAGVK